MIQAPSSSVSVATSARRNSFLDAVRAIAMVRVLVWHTYGSAWISYLIASMPAMFFVAGSLMARSLDHASARSVLYRRFRRLLLPLWLIAVVAVAVMLAYDRTSTSPSASVDFGRAVWWIFPLWDPGGSEWGVTWWTTLWYLRCLTWLLLASPLLLALWRRVGPPLLLAPLAAIAACELVHRAGTKFPWQLEDAALFSLFWILGYGYQDGTLGRISRRWRVVLCLLFAASAAVWAITQEVPGHVVNASYPLHLLVGLAWLFGSLSLEGAIGQVALRPPLAAAISWVNDRALTIYLWHAAGLFCMYQLLWAQPRPEWLRITLGLPIVVSVTFLAVLAVGWVEDVAAARGRAQPAPRGSAGRATRGRLTPALASPALLLVGGAVVAIVLTVSDIAANPSHAVQAGANTVPPSGMGLRIRTSSARIVPAAPPRVVTAERGPVTVTELQAELTAWLEQSGLTGATVTLLRPSGEGWTGAAGSHIGGGLFEPDENYDVASITKTFTVALVLQLVDQGLIELDDPVSRFVPDFPNAEAFTVRQLIQHTSGLIATDGLPPDEALELAAEQGLQFEPGSSFLYSSPGYYLLGLIIEDLLDTPYTVALRQQLLAPLGLSHTWMDEEVEPQDHSAHPSSEDWLAEDAGSWSGGGGGPAHSNTFEYYGMLWSSAGVHSTTSDLARWAVALWGSDRVVSAGLRDAMVTFLGPEYEYAGLGTYPYCPCWVDSGRLRAERWGHLGLTGALEWDPTDQIAIAISTSGTVVDENVIPALDDLSGRLRTLVRGRPMPTLESSGAPVAVSVPTADSDTPDEGGESEIPEVAEVPGYSEGAPDSATTGEVGRDTEDASDSSDNGEVPPDTEDAASG